MRDQDAARQISTFQSHAVCIHDYNKCIIRSTQFINQCIHEIYQNIYKVSTLMNLLAPGKQYETNTSQLLWKRFSKHIFQSSFGRKTIFKIKI